MDDKLLQLAFGIYHSPKVYALLLGSGISRSSGILTGWDILLDLISKMAKLKGAPDVTDYYAWYREQYEHEPNYSEILQILGKTPNDRNNILRSYFEPTEEERAEGLKSPTKAHHAIAALAKRGYFRVILTTNFDRLLEDALKEVGIIPDVISTQDQQTIRASLPLEHPGVTIVKIHGDYRDWRSLNTFEELEQYTSEMIVYLNRIFENFGLIICGWSAEWDIALFDVLRKVQTKRFATYWTVYKGAINDKAQELVQRREAQVLSISGSDEFFSELEIIMQGLENSFRENPISVSVAVERTKRYVANPLHYVELEELIRDETEKVFNFLSSSSFQVDRDKLAQTLGSIKTSAELNPIFQLHLNCVEKLLSIITAFTWYDKQLRLQLSIDVIERLTE